MSDEKLVIVPIPPLVNVLAWLEREKGAPLTEIEVNEARDKAVCMSVPLEVAIKLAQSRGYDDIDPARAWEEWSDYRLNVRPE